MENPNTGSLLVDQYIAPFETQQQQIMKTLRALILSTIPEAEETFSYKMPTYRWNGNLIHFAMYKHHLGIYPGPDAIVHFAKELTNYKTSKGAIQLPLTEPLPKDLIKHLLAYNKAKFQEKTTPNWQQYNAQWSDAIEKMHQIVAKSPLEKTFKWGGDVYTFDGKNVLSFGGFKHHFAVWFYNGVFLKDEAKYLVTASEGKTKSLRQWRFKQASEIDERTMLSYIKEAIQLVKDGVEIKADKTPTSIQPSEIFLAFIEKTATLQQAFEKLTPGKRKEYILHIDEAKQEKTKIARLLKIETMILQGIGLHDKYKK